MLQGPRFGEQTCVYTQVSLRVEVIETFLPYKVFYSHIYSVDLPGWNLATLPLSEESETLTTTSLELLLDSSFAVIAYDRLSLATPSSNTLKLRRGIAVFVFELKRLVLQPK